MAAEPAQRAALSTAAAARDVADSAYAIVSEIGEPASTRERIRAWRIVRLRALTGLDRCVLTELLHGATWEDVADGYGLTPDEMRTRFGSTFHRWRNAVGLPAEGNSAEFSTGLPSDPDPRGTAAALDTWAERHAEPWMTCPSQPVTRAVFGVAHDA